MLIFPTVENGNKIGGASNVTEQIVSPVGEVWQEKDIFQLKAVSAKHSPQSDCAFSKGGSRTSVA